MKETITARDFSVNEKENLSHLAHENKGIILVFVPYPFSPVSKNLLANLNNYYHKYASLGYKVIVIVSDDPGKISELTDEFHFNFEIVNDIDGQIMLEYDIRGLESYSLYPQPLRRVFVVDPAMKIIKMEKDIIPVDFPEDLMQWLSVLDIENFQKTTQDKEFANY